MAKDRGLAPGTTTSKYNQVGQYITLRAAGCFRVLIQEIRELSDAFYEDIVVFASGTSGRWYQQKNYYIF